MKQTSDLLNELFAAWDYSPEGIVIRQDAPEWIRQCVRYVCANMNESENQDILLVLHRFSAFALKHANKADKVDTSAYLDNAALLACEAIPDYLPPLLAWISYNQGTTRRGRRTNRLLPCHTHPKPSRFIPIPSNKHSKQERHKDTCCAFNSKSPLDRSRALPFSPLFGVFLLSAVFLCGERVFPA